MEGSRTPEKITPTSNLQVSWGSMANTQGGPRSGSIQKKNQVDLDLVSITTGQDNVSPYRVRVPLDRASSKAGHCVLTGLEKLVEDA